MTLQFPHSSPRISPVLWQWSTASLLVLVEVGVARAVSGCLQMPHSPFCCRHILSYSLWVSWGNPGSGVHSREQYFCLPAFSKYLPHWHWVSGLGGFGAGGFGVRCVRCVLGACSGVQHLLLRLSTGLPHAHVCPSVG